MGKERVRRIAGKPASEGRRDDVELGRAAYEQRAWKHAYDSLSRADRATPLGGDDLELLATSAYMLGR